MGSLSFPWCCPRRMHLNPNPTLHHPLSLSTKFHADLCTLFNLLAHISMKLRLSLSLSLSSLRQVKELHPQLEMVSLFEYSNEIGVASGQERLTARLQVLSTPTPPHCSALLTPTPTPVAMYTSSRSPQHPRASPQ